MTVKRQKATSISLASSAALLLLLAVGLPLNTAIPLLVFDFYACGFATECNPLGMIIAIGIATLIMATFTFASPLMVTWPRQTTPVYH